MNLKSMDVFSLRDTVIDEYRRFATSFTEIHAADIRAQVEAIYAQGRFWPDPLIQINPSYRRGQSLASLSTDGGLHPRTAEIFSVDGAPLSLYKHQEQAIALAAQGESFVVTTGTGSGKSLCFFIPIVSAILSAKSSNPAPRTRAIIIYPMNALANSQLEELQKFVDSVPGPRPITFARYTGQEDADTRRAIADSPPDILLTNFMMLELLMTRQDETDRKVIGNCADLRFLVLDELHTYRGRQGADVALLVRRVRERLAPTKLQCIGTSATMASEGSLEDKSRVVAAVASRLFAAEIPESNVIVETLERVTDPDTTLQSIASTLGPAIDAGIPAPLSNAAFFTHPLAIWVETRLGVAWSEVDQRWIRARPLTIDEAAHTLSADAQRPDAACAAALRAFLLHASLPERERLNLPNASPRSFFAFKLHQFISGAGHAFATLEPPGKRTVIVDDQVFLPGSPDKRLYPTHFCRECGHEYHPVRHLRAASTPMFVTRNIDDAGPAADDDTPDDAPTEVPGFLTLHATDPEFDFDDDVTDYPDTWLDFDAAGNARLKRTYAKARVLSVKVSPDGTDASGIRAWFIPGRFRFCLRCGATHSSSARDRNRLASLSAEGRSSATTVLVNSTLRWMHGVDSGLGPNTRKLLGFTDNRQDAALQAGHFNDFLFVSLIRSGFLGALQKAGSNGLRAEELGAAQQRALGLDRPSIDLRNEWLLEPNLKGFNLQEAESTLREVLTYRVWFDQRRGWRYTNPNLEQLSLVTVDYLGLEDLAADEEIFVKAPDALRYASPKTRAALFVEVFDHLRKWMAIRTQVLDPIHLEQILQRSHARLRPPWGFATDERPSRARWLFVKPLTKKDISPRDEDLIVRGGSRSALGKTLRAAESPSRRPLWPDTTLVRALKPKDMDTLIESLLEAACVHGLVSKDPTPFGDTLGYRLNGACVRFVLAAETTSPSSKENAFFRDFYASLATMLTHPEHPLFGFEAREHTAQVDKDRREAREKRFRFGEKEREELTANAAQLQQIGEANRFLPVLFCSPTMELGVDISALNAVYLRNVPPTPANYAQRSGRAGRSGQAALVLTYSSSQSPHDQYFFRDPKAMVHGEVRPPLLDLANRDLIESHLSAVWLAATELPLDPSIANLLVLPDPNRPLEPDLCEAMSLPKVQERARERIRRVLDLLSDTLTPELAPWYPGNALFTDEVVDQALARFARAFNRWRDLFSAAEAQRDSARRAMDDYTAKPADKNAARSRHAQAIDQINLLQQGTSSLSSDFYTYRYLATEGFLPGYNFPRLPLMAYIPATADGRGRQTYLQRPRFLALSEFGPRSLVYHEGRAYRVVRAMLALGQHAGSAADVRLPTRTVRICKACGAGHWADDASMCIACQTSLGDAEIINHTYRIENVATFPTDRITANDEERQRQGFDLQTTFEWAMRDHVLDVRRGTADDDAGTIARLAYGPGATITRLNKGLRRRKDKTQLGFKMDPVTGFWAKNNEDEGDNAPADPTSASSQWIVPSVQDRKNALLFQPTPNDLDQITLATVQHALVRGLESVFQLEEGEILAEPMPTRDARTGFLLYEATEGGAGVLTRLVAEPDRLAEVARRALAILHFDLDAGLPEYAASLTDAPDTACVAACYRCVMSYFNQPDHENLDRRSDTARTMLLRLARSKTTGLGPQPTQQLIALTANAPPSMTPAAHPQTDADPTLTAFLSASQRLPPPDSKPLDALGQTLPLVWRDLYVVALFDPPPIDLRAHLEDKGFELVVLGRLPSSWATQSHTLATLLGRS